MTSRSERDAPFVPRLQRTDFEDELRKRLAKVAHRYTVRLTHYGRKTGMPHQVTIWFLVDGTTVYLVTMDMERHWTRNVQARPEVRLEIGEEKFAGEVGLVSEAAEIARVVEMMKKKYWMSRIYLWFRGRLDGVFRVKPAA
jgi:deazaflavin-dependent oxidoreductase (nitroreductase family)